MLPLHSVQGHPQPTPHEDEFSLKKNPEPNPDSLQKAIRLGINYLAGFKGQKVIVTGASKGVGRYVAKSLLDAGAYVACISKNKALLENLTKQYAGQGFAFPYDISDPDITNICFKKVIELFNGELDIFIHCKGTYHNKSFEECNLKEWDDVMNNNCRAMCHLTSLCVPFLETSARNKTIVILTSNNHEKPISGEMLYAVSTSMVNMFIECLALEVSASKIRINGVASNANNSNFRVNKDFGITDFENKIFLENIAHIKPLQMPQDHVDMLAHPDDIANVILWLASNDSSYVNGEIIDVDDGMALTSAYPKPRSMME